MTETLIQSRQHDPSLPATLPALFARSLAIHADRDAIAMADLKLSYFDFDKRIEAMAADLVAAGAGKGSRIALLAPDGILWATVFMAATRIGAVIIAVSTLATAPEMAHIVRHSDAQFLIGVRSFLRHDYVARLEAALPSLRDVEHEWLYLAEAPFLRRIWLVDADGIAWGRPLAQMASLDRPPAGHLARMADEVSPSDDCVTIYTSGSSAMPKAVVHTHRSAATHAMVLARYFRMKPTDRLMPLLPAFWVGGLNMLIEVLGSGGTLIYPQSPNPGDIAAAVRDLAVNRINTWGPQLEKVRTALVAAEIDPDSIVGLAPVLDSRGERVPQELNSNMLGMTETFGPHSAEVMGDALPRAKAGASGHATSDYERRIVDPETGEILADGRQGELQLRRGGLMRGFYKVEPDAVFTADGYYPTGDLARIDADGYLFFEGRRSDVIKTGGANVSRLEVEAALRQVPGVALPIVVPLNDSQAEQIVVAAVVPAAGVELDEEAIKAEMRKLVASYKVPRRIIAISETDIEWTPSHKIKTAALAGLIAARIATDG